MWGRCGAQEGEPSTPGREQIPGRTGGSTESAKLLEQAVRYSTGARSGRPANPVGGPHQFTTTEGGGDASL